MNLFTVFLAIAIAFVTHAGAGCVSPEVEFEAVPGGPSVRFELQFQQHAQGMLTRHIWIHIPKNYQHDEPAPVILAFHAKGQDVPDFEKATNLSNPLINQDYVVVYPEGLNKMWTSDVDAPPRSSVNDVDFVSSVIEFLHRFTPICIDETRIYAAGFSNGGGLVGVLACDEHQSERIAAFAAVSGAFYAPATLKEQELAWCYTRRKPVPFIEFHGDIDPVIDYEGVGTPDGKTFAIPKWMGGKALRAGCDLKKGNITTALANGAVEKVTWHCPKSVGDETIVHYKLKGVGHLWPRREEAGKAEESRRAAPIDATPIVLDFFAKHRIVVGGSGESSQHAANMYDRDEL